VTENSVNIYDRNMQVKTCEVKIKIQSVTFYNGLIICGCENGYQIKVTPDCKILQESKIASYDITQAITIKETFPTSQAPTEPV
jgi:intein/homing endonuclease